MPSPVPPPKDDDVSAPIEGGKNSENPQQSGHSTPPMEQGVKPSDRHLVAVNYILAVAAIIGLWFTQCSIDRAKESSDKQDRRDSIRDARDSVRDFRDSVRLVSQIASDSVENIARDSEFSVRRRYDIAHIQSLALQSSIARTAMESEMRAYLLTDNMTVDTTTYTLLRLDLKNVGRTPASNVVVRAECMVSPFGTIPYENTYIFRTMPSITQAIGPGDFIYVNFSTLTKEQTASYRRGGTLYCYGRITYDDTFGHSDTTEFRLEGTYSGRGPWGISQKGNRVK